MNNKPFIFLIGDNTEIISTLQRSELVTLIKSEMFTFSNSNYIYTFPKLVFNKKLNIVADLSSNLHTHLAGLFFCLHYFKTNNITVDNLIFPYFPYSRSNKIKKDQTSNVFAITKILELFDIKKITTFDPHFGYQTLSNSLKIKIISQDKIFFDEIRSLISNSTIFLGPDLGSSKKISKLAQIFSVKSDFFLKKRIDHKENITFKNNENLTEQIKNSKRIIIFDDEICSGNTIKNLINIIIEINKECEIYIFVTHSFIDNYVHLINIANVKKIYTTNSTGLINKFSHNKLVVKDITSLIINSL